MLCETYARKNLKPAASKRFITDVYSFIRNQNCGEMVVAKTRDDEIASAEIVIWDNRKAYRWAAASDARFLDSGAPSLLLFSILKRLQQRSIPTINLLGGNTAQLSRFIARFNPTLVQYYQVQSRIFDGILSFNK
jgi:lipid II:glycine glycyltransferase (peptidoglycan interpeptide bridge formation enzyme)